MTYYAIRIAPQKERIVRRAFRRQGQTAYLPALAIRKRRHKGKGFRSVQLLFPGYLFLEAPAEELASLWFHHIKASRDVLGFVSVTNDGQPSPIHNSKIDRLRNAIRDDRDADLKRREGGKVGKGRNARIKTGPFAGKVGKVTWMRGDRARIFGWLFGGPREIVVKSSDLEAA